jgi:hypothetical protein
MKIPRSAYLLGIPAVAIGLWLLTKPRSEPRLAKAQSAATTSRAPTGSPNPVTPVTGPDVSHKHSLTGQELLLAKSRYTIDRRRADETKIVDQTFGPILAGLGLSPEELAKVKALLVERYLSAYEAHELAVASGGRGEDFMAAVRNARQQVDEELKATLDKASFSVVEQMLQIEDTSSRITSVQRGMAPAFSTAGAPLTPSQTLGLAAVLEQVYEHNTTDNSSFFAIRLKGFDPGTGLSDLDRQALDSVSTLLSPAQLAILRAQLASDTQNEAKYVTDWAALHSSANH